MIGAPHLSNMSRDHVRTVCKQMDLIPGYPRPNVRDGRDLGQALPLMRLQIQLGLFDPCQTNKRSKGEYEPKGEGAIQIQSVVIHGPFQ